MRVALDAAPLAVPQSGIGRYTRELACHLAEFRSGSGDELLLMSGSLFPPIEGLDSVQGISQAGSITARKWWLVGAPLECHRRSVDVFHGTDFAVPLTGGQRGVLTIHDLSPFRAAEWRMPPTASRIAARLPLMVRRAAAVIVPSAMIRNEVAERFPAIRDRIHVVPLAPSGCFTPAGRERLEDRPYVLYVGARHLRKNVKTLLRAFAHAASHRDLLLILAGPPAWTGDQVLEDAALLGIAERVRVMPALDDERLASLYRGCSVFVYPSFYEGFGLPVIEAMACGAPVITCRGTACAETAGKAALLVDPEDEEDLAGQILEVATAPDLSSRLRRESLQRAAAFSWRQTAEMTWHVYEIAADRA